MARKQFINVTIKFEPDFYDWLNEQNPKFKENFSGTIKETLKKAYETTASIQDRQERKQVLEIAELNKKAEELYTEALYKENSLKAYRETSLYKKMKEQRELKANESK